MVSCLSSIKFLAKLSSTCVETCIGRPCSIHVYHVKPIPEREATSSRLRPGVRRGVPFGKPTCEGNIFALRVFKKSPNSLYLCFELSIVFITFLYRSSNYTSIITLLLLL